MILAHRRWEDPKALLYGSGLILLAKEYSQQAAKFQPSSSGGHERLKSVTIHHNARTWVLAQSNLAAWAQFVRKRLWHWFCCSQRQNLQI